MSAGRSAEYRDDSPFQPEIVVNADARRAIGDINQFFSRARVQRAAAEDERKRLARELHDGVLQSLTAATLQLDAIAHAIAADPRSAVERVKALERLLSEQQRDLRGWIEQLRTAAPVTKVTPDELRNALEKVRQRAAWQGRLRIHVNVTGTTPVPRRLGDEIYRIAQEGLTNVAKHARASVARVDVRLSFDGVSITIGDDGVGFQFHGQYLLADLVRRHLGPASLRDRVAALGGDMVLTSSLSGSQLDVALPLSSP